MSSEEDKPPAPPVRLTSNRGGGGGGVGGGVGGGGTGGSDRIDGVAPVDMKPLPKEPDDADRKKKTLKNKIKVSKASHNDSKPNISYPTNFEHTVHVGFDAVTGEFTTPSVMAENRTANPWSESIENPGPVPPVPGY
uniref:Uncharacterized protein n=1 Tax=Anopheles atroparvus TaxID=41427 RepID=A0A182ILZ8_ANOAO